MYALLGQYTAKLLLDYYLLRLIIQGVQCTLYPTKSININNVGSVVCTLLAIFNFPLDNNALESLHFWVQQFYGKWAFYGSTINTTTTIMDFSKCTHLLILFPKWKNMQETSMIKISFFNFFYRFDGIPLQMTEVHQ